MKTVSFQGTQLSASQRRNLAFRDQTRASFLNSTLQQQVADTEAALAKAKEQGAKPEKLWTTIHRSKGTPFVGDAFGFDLPEPQPAVLGVFDQFGNFYPD